MPPVKVSEKSTPKLSVLNNLIWVTSFTLLLLKYVSPLVAGVGDVVNPEIVAL